MLAIQQIPTVIRKTYPASAVPGQAARTFTVSISSGSVDRDQDELPLDAWDYSEFEYKAFWGHDHQIPAVAKSSLPWVSVGKLKAVATFPPPGKYRFADELYELVQLGYVDSASVEFKPLAWEPRPGGGRRYKHALLLAWSFVNLPANREARVERSTDYAWARKWLSTEPAVPSRGRTWSPASIAQEACVEVKRGWEQIDWTQAAESRSGPLSDPRDQARRQLQQAVVIAKSAGALANERERRCDHVDVFASYGLQVRRREAGLCWKCGRPDPKAVALELDEVPTILELDEDFFEVDTALVRRATQQALARGLDAAVGEAVQQAIDYARGRVH